VKLWSLAEGRQPWTGQGCLGRAERELPDHDSGITHLDSDLCGNLLLTATEEGVLTLWDLRQNNSVWQVPTPGGGGVGGVSLAPDGSEAAVAGSSGRLSLLELRHGGEELSSVECACELSCCTTDGNLLVAGSKAGEVLFWDLRHQRGIPSLSLDGSAPGASPSAPGPDGLYPPLKAHTSAVTALSVSWLSVDNASGPQGLHLASAHADGFLQLFKAC